MESIEHTKQQYLHSEVDNGDAKAGGGASGFADLRFLALVLARTELRKAVMIPSSAQNEFETTIALLGGLDGCRPCPDLMLQRNKELAATAFAAVSGSVILK